jgi:brefeldin A-inhibited guanine nucleotide-exchange protein
VYVRLVNVLSKTAISRTIAADSNTPAAAAITAAMPLTSASVQGHLSQISGNMAVAEVSIRHKALESLVSILRSLGRWADKSNGHGSEGTSTMTNTPDEPRLSRASNETTRTTAVSTFGGNGDADTESQAEQMSAISSPANSSLKDDPEQFTHKKQRKQLLEEGIRLFAWKPKRVCI